MLDGSLLRPVVGKHRLLLQSLVFMPWHCVYFNGESKKDELVLSCKLNEGSIATHSNITRRIPELCSNRMI